MSAPKTDAVLQEWLDDIRDFLDNRADADLDGDGRARPNEAMSLLVQMDCLFPKVAARAAAERQTFLRCRLTPPGKD